MERLFAKSERLLFFTGNRELFRVFHRKKMLAIPWGIAYTLGITVGKSGDKVRTCVTAVHKNPKSREGGRRHGQIDGQVQ